MRCNKDLYFLTLHLKLCVLAIDPVTSIVNHLGEITILLLSPEQTQGIAWQQCCLKMVDTRC
jgi:hypothetical protein